jgi:hypothetical protein
MTAAGLNGRLPELRCRRAGRLTSPRQYAGGGDLLIDHDLGNAPMREGRSADNETQGRAP